MCCANTCITKLVRGGSDVDLVAMRHRAQQIRAACAQLEQELRRRPVAGDDKRVQLALHRLHPRTVGVDNRHVVPLRAQRTGDVLANLAATDDDDSHRCIVATRSALVCASGETRVRRRVHRLAW